MLLDTDAAARARAHQLHLTKPAGSLGRLEDLGAFWAAARGQVPGEPVRGGLAVFAADHGVVAEGVSAWPREVTLAMVANMLAGGAAVSVLARRSGVALRVVDTGVAGDTSGFASTPDVTFVRRPVGAGTRNMRREPAMTDAECAAARAVGAATLNELADAGVTLLGLGEVGIGNTTAATALVAACTGADPAAITGRGAGIDEATRVAKAEVIADALRHHRLEAGAITGESGAAFALRALACVGGFELAAMVGAICEAPRRRVPIMLDGLMTNAAALVAVQVEPRAADWLIASHRSAEPAAHAALAALDLAPLLDLELRLGEGSGAVLGIDLVATAVTLQREMATFAGAGVPGRDEGEDA